MKIRLCLLLLLLLAGNECSAQWNDDFEDGELRVDPAWTGDLLNWEVEAYDRGRRLRTHGPARADTLLLTTTSGLPYGTWTTRHGYRGGPLTNFNHVRLVLWASSADLLIAAGYMLQVGANDRSIRLYEFGSGISSRRLVATAPFDDLESDSTDLAIVVERSYDDRWAIAVNDLAVISVETSPDPDSLTGIFGLWVKHTAARGADYWFDDVGTDPAVRSDTTPPRVVRAVATSRTSVSVRFSEPLFRSVACGSGSFKLLPGDTSPVALDCTQALVVDSLTMHFGQALPEAARLAALLADPSANTSADTATIDVSRIARLPVRGDVVINEINYAPNDSESEFVEILNISNRELDLSGVALTDDRTRSPIGDTSLAPGAYLTLTKDSVSIAMTFGDFGAVQLEPWPSLNNTGDRISLVQFDTLDSVAYEPSWNDGPNSLERRDPYAPSGFPGNWGSSLDPFGGTPGARNSIFSQDRTPPQLTFAGLLPGLPQHVAVFFSEDIDVSRLKPTDFLLNGLPAQRVVRGNEIYSDRTVLRFPEVRAGTLSAANVADPTGNISVSSETRLHLRPDTGAIVIHEIMYQPIADRFDGLPDQVEYVELRSRSSEPLAVNGCALIGRTSEDGDTSAWFLPDGPTGLSSHTPTALVRAGNVATLMESFHLESDASIIAIDEGGLNLPSERSPLILECPGAGRIDSVTYDPSWHDGALLSARGRSLERIDVHAPSNEPTNWTTTSSPLGGTPAAHNSVSMMWTVNEMRTGDVVITELLFEPRSDDGVAQQYEYIEIYNRSDAEIDLNGAAFLEGHVDSTVDASRFVFAPTRMKPGEYGLAMLVPSSAGEANPDDLLARAFPSTADHAWPLFVLRRSGLTLPNDGGVLALLNRSSEVVDRITYSPDAHHPHLAETRGVALERISPSSSGEHPLNWSSSVHPEGGTPGRQNSVAAIAGRQTRTLSINPSPFTPDGDGDRDHAVITYNLGLTRPLVRITVFDSRGREVRRLTGGQLSGPSGSIIWDGFNRHGGPVSPGIYIIYLQAVDKTAGLTEVHKQVVVVAPPFD